VYRVEVINSVYISIEAASVRPTIRYCILTGGGAAGGPIFGIWSASQAAGPNYHGQDVTVDHCVISGYFLNGIYTGGMAGYNTSVRPNVTNCIFIENNTDGGAAQIDVEGWAVVRGCKFFHVATIHSFAIEAHGGGNFTDNLGIAAGSDRSFMEIQGGGPYDVTRNTASGYGAGVQFDQGFDGTRVTDYVKVYLNDFTGCGKPYNSSLLPSGNYGTDGTHNYIVAPVSEINFGASVASASTISPTGAVFTITGTTTINNINAVDITKGTELKMITANALTFTIAGNLAFNGGAAYLTTSAGDMVIAVWDGTRWRLR
jgi:hypothetical protein